ncbi:MAG: GyrI-like domain-containing protein [Lentimicrobium sp.]
MKAFVVEKSPLKVVGLTLHTSFKDGRNKTEIPPFFHKVLDEGRLDLVPDRLNANQLCVFNMQRNNPDFDYTMGVEVSKADGLPENMQLIHLPGSKYVAVKTVKRGPEDVTKAFEFIFKTWIPGSVYIPTGTPSFIYYDEEFFRVFNQYGYAGNPQATVFVPIKPLFIKQMLGFLGLKKFTK